MIQTLIIWYDILYYTQCIGYIMIQCIEYGYHTWYFIINMMKYEAEAIIIITIIIISVCISLSLYIYICIHISLYIIYNMCIYIYIYRPPAAERERPADGSPGGRLRRGDRRDGVQGEPLV